MKKDIKKLTSRDVALGIGRQATDEEMDQYLNRERKGTFKSIQQIREEINIQIDKRNQKRKAS